MTGCVVSRYRVLEKLGQGGMGVVYKARDLRLERLVALKFVRANRLEHESARQRFVTEAKAVAALDHPNICTIYSIEDTDEGETFITTAYYEGENLQRRIERGVISVAEALDIAVQIGRALSTAHEHGIVHRDVKPANVMLTPDGTVKLLDFGAAFLEGTPRSTQPGIAVGTPTYMAPEQARGEQCDARTDIWALGAVLYTMLTGRPPFRGSNDPAPPSRFRSGIPGPLDDVVLTALFQDPDRRYQTASELITALSSVQGAGTAPSDSSETMTEHSLRAGPPQPSIAVLPFTNVSRDPENEYLSDGISEELITALAKIEGLRVVSRTSAFQFKGKAADVRQIGENLHVRTVLEGRVRVAGDRVRVTAQLVNAADGYQVWSERFDRKMEDIFAIQDEIAQCIVAGLSVRLAAGIKPGELMAQRRPQNLTAYTLYLKGRFHWNKQTREALRCAAEYFEQAIVEDPDYAPAWAGLAEYYIALGFWSMMPADELWPKARKNAARALQLDSSIPHVQISAGYVRMFCDWDWIEAEDHFRRAVQLGPGDSQARFARAVFLTQVSRLDEALSEMRHALTLDPLAIRVNMGLALLFYYRREYDRALEQAHKTLDLDPNSFEMQVALARICLQTSHLEKGLRALEQAGAFSGDNPVILGWLGYGYGLAGLDRKARDVLLRLDELSRERYVAPVPRALVYIGLGAHDEAFAALERAASERDALLCYLDVMPCYDPLRRDERFPMLRNRVGNLFIASRQEVRYH